MKRLDKRQFGRRTTHIQGTILIAGKRPVPCIVRNISQQGAFLEYQAQVWMPTFFQLHVEQHGFQADCEQRHRSDRGVGVFFLNVRIAKDGSDIRLIPGAGNMPSWTERDNFRIV